MWTLLNKDFENFELKLQALREEQRELYDVAENIFQESYASKLENIFPRDILGIKKKISAFFIIAHAESTQRAGNTQDIFKKSLDIALSDVPLSWEKKLSLKKHILKLWESSETLEKYFRRTDDLSRDPFFALVEDFSIDWEISREEFLLLSESYGKSWNFFTALEWLPEPLRKLFESHVGNILGKNWSERKHEFESEYSSELDVLQKRGLNIEPVARFISRSYYKTPGKLRKYEDPRRRLRRTMKMSLLRLLRLKLGNINAEEILRKFETGESFEDFFMLLYKLLEVVNEDVEWDEIYSLLDMQEETEELVVTAEETKKKILEWEELTASISSLLWDTDGKLEWEMFEKLLDDDTHFHGDEVQFAHGDTDMAWIYAESTSDDWDDEEEQEDDLIDVWDTLEWNYESLKMKFQDLDEKKRKAFWLWEYDLIDEYNEELMRIESRIIKLAKLLGEEV